MAKNLTNQTIKCLYARNVTESMQRLKIGLFSDETILGIIKLLTVTTEWGKKIK